MGSLLGLSLLAELPAVAARLQRPTFRIPSRLGRIGLGVAVLLSLLRAAPADATMPPPVMRFELPKADAAPPPATAVQATDASIAAAYVVAAGDSLWAIARRHLEAGVGAPVTSGEVARFWPLIYRANEALIGGDPDLIFPGQVLQLPQPPGRA
jgi:nucleoid-associated protein YgaU